MALFGGYETSKLLEQIKSHKESRKPVSDKVLLIYHITQLLFIIVIMFTVIYFLFK